jgi:GGDEF domain-containing protein
MASELDDAFDALPEAPVAAPTTSLDAQFDALPETPAEPELAAAPVSAFKAKVGLSDPWEGSVRKYAQIRAEQEDSVRKGFKAASEPGLAPDVADARVASYFNIPLETVKANRPAWLDTFAKASGDPAKWIAENPLSAELVLEHPERADQVVSDKELNGAMKAVNAALDWTTDLWDSALKAEAEMPWGGAAKAVRDTAGRALAVANGLVIGADKAQAEVDALTQPRTPEQQQATIEARAQRDAPRQVTEVDNAEAFAMRQRNDPLEIIGQRAKENRAQLELGRLWGNRLFAKRGGADTTVLDAQIADAEERAKGLKLDETGWTQGLAEAWGTAQSTIDVLGTAIEGMGEGALVGGTIAAVPAAFATKSPAATAKAFGAGASMGARVGGTVRAAEGSFRLELGDSYKSLLQAKTDSGHPLTENEAAGGALIAASLKTGVELAELSLIIKAVGPAGAFFEKGGINAVKQALATNPGFRALAVKAAKAWIGEGIEEPVQGAIDDAVSYLDRSKADGFTWQKGPVVDTEGRKQDLVMGLMGGSIFGVGGLVTSTTTHAVFRAKNERAATLAPALAALAENPAAQEMAPQMAALITAKTAEQGDEVTHQYVDASAFRTFFQTKEEADAKITELMGENGPRALAGAEFTGGKLQVPLADYLGKWGKDGLAVKLAEHTASRSDRSTPAELKVQQAEDEAFAKSIADENRPEGVSPTLDRFDALEQQLVDSGRSTAEAAKASMVPLRQAFTTLAKRFGQKAEDLFHNVRLSVDDGTKPLLLEARQAHASHRLSAELADGLDVTTAAERLFVDDHVTGLYTYPAFELMQSEKPAPSVATLTLTDIKPVNDSVLGGHDTANALLAHVAAAVAAVDPEAARKGTNFVFRGGEAELQRALEGVRSMLPEGMAAEGAVGADVGTAMTTMDTLVNGKRADGALALLSPELLSRAAQGLEGLSKEEAAAFTDAGLIDDNGKVQPTAADRVAGEQLTREGETDAQRTARADTFLPKRGTSRADLTKLPDMERSFASTAAARVAGEQDGTRTPLRVRVSESMKAKVAAMKPHEYFRHAYQDATAPGVLSATAWENIPRKAFVASIDIKGLKAINDLGKEVGDKVLGLFAQTARDFDGSDFDFAHLSGDEYAAQHDSQEKLQAWLDRIEHELTKVGVPHTVTFADGEKITERIAPRFRSGIGEKTYGNADRVLNAAKLEEKRRSEGGVQGAAPGERSDLAGGRSGVRAQVPGGEVQRPLHQRRGAAAQAYVPQLRSSSENVGGRGGRGDVSVSERGAAPAEVVPTVEADPAADFDTAALDAELALDAADEALVSSVLAERGARGPLREQEAEALRQGFNLPGGIAAAREAMTRFRAVAAKAPAGRADTKAAKAKRQADAEQRLTERRAALETFIGWVENTGPKLTSSTFANGGGTVVSEALHRETVLTARTFGLVDPQSGIDSLYADSLRGTVGKEFFRKKKKGSRDAASQEREREQRRAFETNVLGRVPSLRQGNNGFIDIAFEGTDKVYRIGLLPTSNPSTFLHESSHVFLDLFGELAARADAPASVRADWATTLAWLGVTEAEWAGMTAEQQTPHHEKWADTFEAYLSEGKEPSHRLAGAFQRFRLWMGAVYRRLNQLGPVAPEIRGVFDRLLATDEEIANAKKAMGLEALPRDLLGMSVEDYQTHLDELAQATSGAVARIDAQVTKDKLRATEAWWREAHAEAKRVAGEEFEAIPARQAQQLLQGKQSGDFMGIVLPLHRATVEAWVGAKAAARFHLAKDGVHPDEVAEAYGYALGYGTGRDLVEAVAQLPEKEDYVDGRADEMMVEQHPGALDERQKLREAAQQAMHGKPTKAWALKELAALTAKGSKTNPRMPTAAHLQRAAQLIAAGQPAGQLGIHAALVAERAAATSAVKAAMRGDFEQAIVFKQKQLLNMYLYDVLRDAKEEVDAVETLAAKLGKLKSRQRLGKGSPVYRDAVDLLLSTFGFTEAAGTIKGSLDALLGQVEQLMAENADTVAFDKERILDRAEQLQPRTTAKGRPIAGWKDLALEDLRHVARALENIDAAARNRTTILVEQKRVDKEATIASLLTEGEQLVKRADEPTQEAENQLEAWSRRWNQFDGGLLKVERMAEWLSGAADTAGFVRSTWFKAIVQPMQSAKARAADLAKAHLTPLVEAFEAVPPETRARWQELIDGRKLFPNHIEEKLPRRRWEVLMMLLHSGNLSNLERLTEGRGITEQEVRDAAVAVGVTKQEYAWLQGIWDTAEGLKPLAFDLEEADSGVRPDAIPARPFATPHGMMPGGYFPAVYDRITQVGKEQEATLAGFQDKSFTRPGTSHSFLKKRSEGFTDVISLSPGSIYRHFNQVIHDLSYRQAVKSVGTLLLDKQVQQLLRQRIGSGRAEQFLVWVGDIARARGASANDGLGVLANLAQTVRGNTVVAVLGYKIPNALEDATSNLLSSMAASDLHPKHLASAISDWALSPKVLRAEALAKSGELRARQNQTQREFALQIRKLTENGAGRFLTTGPLGWYKDHAFALNEAVEVATSTPIWIGAHRQAIQAGMSDAEAVTFADATIRQVLPSHNLVDLSTIMRNKGVIGQLLMFHGAFNHFYNQFRTLGHRFVAAEDTATRAKMAGRAAGLSIGLFVVGALARGQGPEKGEPVEEWLFRKLALEGFMQLVPGLNEAGNVLASVLRGKPTTPRNNSLTGVAGAIVDAASTMADGDKDTSKRVLKGLSMLGPTTGLPISGPLQIASPLINWVTGESDARNPGDVASDAVYGRKKGAPANGIQGFTDLVAGPR